MLHWLARALLVGLVLVLCSCASAATDKSQPTRGGEATGWSEAERRAKARQAWLCLDQAPAQLATTRRGPVRARGPRSREWNRRCSYTRLLCQQIHRGAQATEVEKAECAAYESVHGRVTDP